MATRNALERQPEEGGHELLEGTVLSVLYQDVETGFGVVQIEVEGVQQAAAGSLAPVHEGQHLRLHGRWQVHPRFGKQFRAAWTEVRTPSTLAGLERYLGGGAFPGIGPDMARRLVAHFGENTLQAIEEGPDRLREVDGIGPKRAGLLAEVFDEHLGTHRVMAELRGFGLNGGQARAVYEEWEAAAVEKVRRDPYALVGRIRGVGFETAERIARQVGIPRDSTARARGVLVHLLRQASREGHACLPQDPLWDRLAELGLGDDSIARGAGELIEQRRVVREGEGGGARWYLGALWEAETGVAASIARLAAQDLPPPATPEHVLAAMRRAAFQPDESQRRAVEMTLREPLTVLTGGPGTGKTTTLRLLLEILESAGVEPVRLASPTGRAAKRLHEATGREASTVHRLLGFDPRTMSFRHDEDAPLEAKVIVVDEVSMLDLPLAHALLRAVPSGCRVVLVGDADQLPSVGPGSVLRDLVAARAVPTVRLERIHRQAHDSGIVEAAHQILHGELPEDAGRAEKGDFFLSYRRDSEQAAALVERLVCERIPRRYGLDPMRDVLVLSPMYRGPLGVDALNERLGRRLNPDGAAAGSSERFRIGDRVMVVRNDYEREVFNGDTGRVTGATGSDLVVEIDGQIHSYRSDQLGDLIPAWCVTVHRSQGSEARAVVVVVDRSHWLMLRRNLVYTAVTRGKELVCLVADPAALRRAVQNDAESERHGGLTARLEA